MDPELMAMLEPGTPQYVDVSTTAVLSLAISLKRIADAIDAKAAGKRALLEALTAMRT